VLLISTDSTEINSMRYPAYGNNDKDDSNCGANMNETRIGNAKLEIVASLH